MASPSVIYRSAVGYEMLMRALYGRHYRARTAAVAARVPPGSSVLELCCGPGTLYRQHLRERTTSYVGLDVNDRFVAQLRATGVDARVLDLTGDAPWPAADVAVIQASLYHFLPDAARIVERMLDAANERVIIAEPVRNLASSGHPLIARIGRRAADPGVGGHAARFTEQTLDELLGRYAERTLEVFMIPGGREKVYVLSAQGQPGTRSVSASIT